MKRRTVLKTPCRKSSEEELEALYEEFELDYHRRAAVMTRQKTACSDDLPNTPLATGFRPMTVRPVGSRCGTARPITGVGVGDNPTGLNRPLTAIRRAGFTAHSQSRPGQSHDFDPMKMSQSQSSIVKIDPELSDINKIRSMELRIWELIDDSAVANEERDFKRSLTLAKESELKEKVLQKQEEEEDLFQTHDWDLTFSVKFNLAVQYEDNDLFTEALNTYSTLNGEQFAGHGSKVKLNIGNIFVKKHQYAKAIKVYRIALDQLGPKGEKGLRIKLLQNTGLAFLAMRNYGEAATNFETVMIEKPNFEAAFNLTVTHYMIRDSYAIKSSFQELLQIPLPEEDETLLEFKEDPTYHSLYDLYKHDALSKFNADKKSFGEKCVLTAACLIAPVVERNLTEGYDWVMSVVKTSQHAAFAPALQISKCVELIQHGKISEAMSILLEFEGSDNKFLPAAANNLSFLYYLQGNYSQAFKFGEIAVSGDCYNEKSFVNLGNSLAAMGDLDRARALYFAAYRLNSSSLEVMYNLGLIDLRLGHYGNALTSFKKVVHILPGFGDALYQIAQTYELIQDYDHAMEYYLKALAVFQNDSSIYKKLGLNADRLGGNEQAYSYFAEAYHGNPCDTYVIKWLAMYMVESGLPDQAMEYFQKGMTFDPADPIWLLSMAACQKQLGNTAGAIYYYKQTLQNFFDNLDALEGLVALGNCLERKEALWYRSKFDEVSCRVAMATVPVVLETGKVKADDSSMEEDEATPRCSKISENEMNQLWNFDLCGTLDSGDSDNDEESG